MAGQQEDLTEELDSWEALLRDPAQWTDGLVPHGLGPTVPARLRVASETDSSSSEDAPCSCEGPGRGQNQTALTLREDESQSDDLESGSALRLADDGLEPESCSLTALPSLWFARGKAVSEQAQVLIASVVGNLRSVPRHIVVALTRALLLLLTTTTTTTTTS